MLKVRHLKKTFGDQQIWNNLSRDFLPGEIVSIKGKSGEGKTTFLRCLNFLETVDGGEVSLDGDPLLWEENGKVQYAQGKDRDRLRKNIGMVFQNFNLFPHLSVEENLLIAPKFRGEDPEESKAKAEKLLEDMGIGDKGDSYPHQLSGGQKQRVAIARACMDNPQVLCFDEPTSALDEFTVGQVEEIISRLAQKGMTVLVVTHDSAFARRISHRILTIQEGEFVEETEE